MPHATASAASSTVHMGKRVQLDHTMTVLLVGVGGQGTILAGNILAMTASEAGLDVKVSEIHGMSQRGGSVSTIIRMGEHVDSMVCDPGTADVLVA
ncbi:MAG: 2-oxoacid:acceptor oxidoreductase family protein, partial [Olsenella sp.]|nr:2-oxoacid:acceptor oxidoreductase family protein [Olsenella sp.]